MLIKIDTESAQAIFEQVAASVRADIVTGRLSAGDRLPSARAVSEALDVNVHTVLHAYQRLRDEGLLDLRRGRGAVVSAAASPLSELRDDIRALVVRASSLGMSAEALASLVRHSAPQGEPA